MNIRDYKKVEPLLKRFEELCKEIGMLKASAKLIATHSGSLELDFPVMLNKKDKSVSEAEYDVDNTYPFDVFRRICSMPGFVARPPIGNEYRSEQIFKYNKIKISESLLLRIHGLIISERVEERKAIVDQLKKLGFHYDNSNL